MVFSSPIFLFAFLPAVLLIHFFAGKRLRNLVLLAASLFFYAWGETFYVLLMIASIIGNHGFALLLHQAKNSNRRGEARSKWILALGIVFNLGLLLFFKYTNFIVTSWNELALTFGFKAVSVPPIHLPIGISFFTFQALSYLVDVFRQVCEPQKNLLRSALYISFFPQLIAGPIVRYQHVASQIAQRHVNVDNMAAGIKRFIIGLGKKVLIANTLGATADAIFSIPVFQISTPLSWLGIVCYAFQIYYDFSGYSDMAIGLGRMFGFHFLENFNYPYISQSIREFWRRWHISLSSWFRDYLYIPLGGNRGGGIRTYANLMIVFFLCGLWHGASWTFVLWGMYHGLFLILERTPLGKLVSWLWAPIRNIYTLLVVLVGWVFFRAETVSYALEYLKAMAGFSKSLDIAHSFARYWSIEVAICLGMAFLGSMPVYPKLVAGTKKLIEMLRSASVRYVFDLKCRMIELGFLMIIFLASAAFLAADTYNPFIYFRF